MAVLTEAKTFADAWTAADQVTGWLTEEEARTLFDAAMQTPEGGSIVEVGSFMGRSLTILAHTGRTVTSIDPLELGVSIAKTQITEKTVAALARVIDTYPNVYWRRCYSQDANAPLVIDMLHIDACHKYPYPLNDYRAFEKALYVGSLVAFHDYGREFGVTKSVDELMASGELEYITKGGTMIVTRKL